LDENVKDGTNTWDESSSSIVYICCKEQTKNCDILQGKCQRINPLVKELLTWYLGTREIGADKRRKMAGFLMLAHWHPWATIANHESWTNWSELYIWVGMSQGMFCSCIKYLTNWNLCVCQLLQAHMWGSICFSNKKIPKDSIGTFTLCDIWSQHTWTAVKWNQVSWTILSLP
jgi:hypothetical protein